MNILDTLKKELVVKKVPIKEKIKVDEEVLSALNFLNEVGLPIDAIVEEALSTWRKKGVVTIANEIKKDKENESEI